MKHILLLGLLAQPEAKRHRKRLLFDADDPVTLFARHAGELFSDSPRMAVIIGDAEKVADLKKTMQGQGAVFCAMSGEALPQIVENEI